LLSEEEATYEEEEIQERRYGARVSPLSGHDVILVEQTSRLHPGTGNNRYTIDHHPDQRPNARHVRLDDDQAIRDALLGQL
jgi:hypothetical protein